MWELIRQKKRNHRNQSLSKLYDFYIQEWGAISPTNSKIRPDNKQILAAIRAFTVDSLQSAVSIRQKFLKESKMCTPIAPQSYLEGIEVLNKFEKMLFIAGKEDNSNTTKRGSP